MSVDVQGARYVEAPAVHDGGSPAVFLAGGISGCPDWQTEARLLLADVPVVLLSPRQSDFDVADPGATAEQVRWEFEHLRVADIILFWFPDSGAVVQPIALYELGAHAALGKSIAVGCDPGYIRRGDVILQLGHARPKVTVRDSLEAVCADVRALVVAPQVAA